MNKKNVSPNNDPESKSVAFVMLWFHFFSMVDAAMRYFFLSSFRRFFSGGNIEYHVCEEISNITWKSVSRFACQRLSNGFFLHHSYDEWGHKTINHFGIMFFGGMVQKLLEFKFDKKKLKLNLNGYLPCMHWRHEDTMAGVWAWDLLLLPPGNCIQKFFFVWVVGIVWFVFVYIRCWQYIGRLLDWWIVRCVGRCWRCWWFWARWRWLNWVALYWTRRIIRIIWSGWWCWGGCSA